MANFCIAAHCSRLKNKINTTTSSHINEGSLVSKNLVDQSHTINNDEKQSLPPPSYSKEIANNYARFKSGKDGVLTSNSPAAHLLDQPVIIIRGKPDMLLKRANRCDFTDVQGNKLGYMYQAEGGYTTNVFRLSKPLVLKVFDSNDNHILTYRKRFSATNPKVGIYTPPDEAGKEYVIGGLRQRNIARRLKYDLFLADSQVDKSQRRVKFRQFASTDEPYSSAKFAIVNDGQKEIIGLVDRKWEGRNRQIFSDSRDYALYLDPQDTEKQGETRPTNFEERAVILATVFSIDYDNFSPTRTLYGS